MPSMRRLLLPRQAQIARFPLKSGIVSVSAFCGTVVPNVTRKFSVRADKVKQEDYRK